MIFRIHVVMAVELLVGNSQENDSGFQVEKRTPGNNQSPPSLGREAFVEATTQL